MKANYCQDVVGCNKVSLAIKTNVTDCVHKYQYMKFNIRKRWKSIKILMRLVVSYIVVDLVNQINL